MSDKTGDLLATDVSPVDEVTGVRLTINTGGSAAVAPVDSGGARIDPAKEGGNLAAIKTSTDKLDVDLSTVAKDSTLARLTVAQGAALGSNTQALVGGSVSADEPTYTAGQVSPLSLTPAGRLRASTKSESCFASGTLAALNATVAIVATGQPSVTFMLNGTWSGTVVAEGLSDSTWVLAHTAPSGDLIGTASIVSTTSSSDAPYTVIPLPLNCTQYRLRMSAYTSGSVAVTIQENDTNPIVLLAGVAHGGTMRQVASVDRVLNYNLLSTMALDFSAHECFEKRIYSMSSEYTLPTSGTETPAFLARNPVGNTRILILYRMQLDMLTDGAFSRCRLYANPTGTITGTAAAIVSRNIGGGAAASSMTALTGALSGVTANGSRLNIFSVDSNNGREITYHFNTIVQPGNTLLITGTPDANNRILGVTIIWSEISI